jgi:hypothetical protein
MHERERFGVERRRAGTAGDVCGYDPSLPVDSEDQVSGAFLMI